MATITFDEREAAMGMSRFFSVNPFLTPLGTDYVLGDVAGYAINFHGAFAYNGSNVPNVGSMVTSADLWGANGIAYAAVTGLNFDLRDLYDDLHGVNGALSYETIIGISFGASKYIGTTHDDFLLTYASNDTLIGGNGDDNLIANTGISFIFLGEGVPSAPGTGPSNAVMVGGAGNDSFTIFDQHYAPYVENVAGGNEDGTGGAGEFNSLQVSSDGVTIRHISNIQEIDMTVETLNLRDDASLAANLIVYNDFGLDPVTINFNAYGDEVLIQNNTSWNIPIGYVEVNYSSAGINSADYIAGPNGASKVTVHSGGGADTLVMNMQVAEIDGGSGVDYLRRDLNFTSIDFSLDLTRSHNDMGFTGFIDNIERASIVSGGGDDRLVGGAYADTFIGGGGDDVIIGGAGGDYLDGGSGYDVLLGGAGKDILVATLSSDGVDVMQGGADDDIYILDSEETMVAEKIGGGTDTVYSSATWTLGGNFERLVLTGTSAISGTGNYMDNMLTGNGAANTLKGAEGADTINGGVGDDLISGGTGKDQLTGGTGKDSFLFNTGLSSSNVDTITDFSHVSDVLKFDRDFLTNSPALGTLSAGAFYAANGATQGHDGTDRFIYNKLTGAVYYDRDGNGGAASIKVAVLSGHPTIDASDFYIIV